MIRTRMRIREKKKRHEPIRFKRRGRVESRVDFQARGTHRSRA